MTLPIGLVGVALFIVIAELGRALVGKLFGYQAERHAIPIMKLPGSRGTQGFRLALILAGPVTVYLVVAVMAFALFKCNGIVVPEGATEISETMRGFDAATKLAAGDTILEVDGAPFAGGAPTLSHLITAKQGASVALTIERAGAKHTVTLEPTQREGRWLVGIVLTPKRDHGMGKALGAAILYPANQAAHTFEAVIEIVKGSEQAEAGGPVRIVEEFSTAFETSLPQVIIQIGMIFGVYTLIGLALFDLVRALLLILFRS
jgi:membrane-associated protease RseP (regulator of RpoE activity)